MHGLNNYSQLENFSYPLTDFELQRGMDRYLDSLFDPVLSDRSEV